jgi:hypothetical protein
MPLIEPNAKTIAAVGLIRAGIADDPDAGVLIIQQNGGAAAYRADPAAAGELQELIIALTAQAVKTLLAANGWDVERALKVIDGWTNAYARHPAARAGM